MFQPSTFPWDLAILLLIAGPFCLLILVALALRKPRGWKAKTFLHAVGILCFATSMTVLYGSFLEPRIITVTERSVPFPYPEELTIAVFGDLHAGPYKGEAFLWRVVDRINGLRPDLVLFAGDFLFDGNSPLEDLEPFAELRPSIGTVAVFGNHDMGRMQNFFGQRFNMADRSRELRRFLQDRGVTVLENENILFQTSKGSFAVAGTGDLWAADVDWGKSFAKIPEERPVILLTHNPDVSRDPQGLRADVTVSGHTHGGQFRLPFFGPIAPVPVRIGKDYSQGIFTLTGGTTLAITRGIGETRARARLFAWPEILLLKTVPR
ncbi:MAG: metallophosphoesterase [Patescibacteria group bacterium]